MSCSLLYGYPLHGAPRSLPNPSVRAVCAATIDVIHSKLIPLDQSGAETTYVFQYKSGVDHCSTIICIRDFGKVTRKLRYL